MTTATQRKALRAAAELAIAERPSIGVEAAEREFNQLATPQMILELLAEIDGIEPRLAQLESVVDLLIDRWKRVATDVDRIQLGLKP